jgi:hypothetical protein
MMTAVQDTLVVVVANRYGARGASGGNLVCISGAVFRVRKTKRMVSMPAKRVPFALASAGGELLAVTYTGAPDVQVLTCSRSSETSTACSSARHQRTP